MGSQDITNARLKSFITVIEEDRADPALADAYAQIRQWRGGRLPPVLQVVGLHPEAMMAVKHLNEAVSSGNSTLGARREELIATAVSVMNGCDY